MQSEYSHSVPVLVMAHNCINELGVIRNLGKHDVPLILLTSDRMDMVRYSRYVSKRIACPRLRESETQFIEFLIMLGKQMDGKCVIIPTSDNEVITLSRYRKELEQYYLLPIPHYEVVQKLVNKKKFYQWLEQISIPHPRTYFPEDISELKTIGQEVEYPYIIKPVYVHLFVKEVNAKCFVINSAQELEQAIGKLRDKDIEVMIQEIIPGKEIYMFYTYFNKESEPMAVCGYDKLRQYPSDFGNGSLCRSAWRSGPIDSAIQVLKALKYHGMAEPEFKKDPRDGRYKLLEINARTTTESRLPARCGVNIEYIAYLDTIGQYKGNSVTPQSGIIWMDELYDLASCFSQIKQKTLSAKEVLRSLKGKKVFAIASWDDPLPFLVSLFNLGLAALRRLLLAVRGRNNRHQ